MNALAVGSNAFVRAANGTREEHRIYFDETGFFRGSPFTSHTVINRSKPKRRCWRALSMKYCPRDIIRIALVLLGFVGIAVAQENGVPKPAPPPSEVAAVMGSDPAALPTLSIT